MILLNKITRNTILLGMMLVTVGCEKVLEKQPYNAFTDESVFTTVARANLALNGVYDAAQTGGPTLGGRGYPFGAATVEQGDNRGEDMVNLQAFYQITYQGTYTPFSANNVAMWDNNYALINKANIAIEGFKSAVASGVLPAATATQFEAECRFLRALAHHELLIHFARPYLEGNGAALGVPYRDYAVKGGESLERVQKEARPKVSDAYAKLIEDLNFAEANLPAINASGAIIRAQKSAAIALKQRVYLHMGQFSNAITAGNALIPTALTPASPNSTKSLIGNHALTATPNGSFGFTGGGNSISSENIFTIKNDPLDNGSVNGALAAMYGSTDLLGRGLVCVSPIIWNNAGWLAEDLRRTTLYRNGGTAIGRAMLTTKYNDYSGRGDNTPIIRWAEVLLNQAEAEARVATAVSQRAIDLLNLVRNRSVTTTASQYTAASFASRIDLLKAILLERRIEFLAEGRRWPDIHRTAQDPIVELRASGIPAKVSNGGVTGTTLAQYGIGLAVTLGQPAIPYSDFRFIWPIPGVEVTTNPIIVQNPGY
jgi:hypothetical protein